MNPLSSHNSLDRTVRHFRRVAVKSVLYLTVEVPGGATKGDVQEAIQKTLRSVTDADDAISLNKASVENPVLYIPTKEERTINEEAIFILRGAEVVDAFTQDEEVAA